MASSAATSLGNIFLAHGYFVNTIGRDEAAIRALIQEQEKEDVRLEQMNLFRWGPPPIGGSSLGGRVSAPLRPRIAVALSVVRFCAPSDRFERPIV